MADLVQEIHVGEVVLRRGSLLHQTSAGLGRYGITHTNRKWPLLVTEVKVTPVDTVISVMHSDGLRSSFYNFDFERVVAAHLIAVVLPPMNVS